MLYFFSLRVIIVISGFRVHRFYSYIVFYDLCWARKCSYLTFYVGFCSCSLETLSTLKFAQRAKFIKNNVRNFFVALSYKNVDIYFWYIFCEHNIFTYAPFDIIFPFLLVYVDYHQVFFSLNFYFSWTGLLWNSSRTNISNCVIFRQSLMRMHLEMSLPWECKFISSRLHA